MDVVSLAWDDISPPQKLLLGFWKLEGMIKRSGTKESTARWGDVEQKLKDHGVLYRPSIETRPWSRLSPVEQEAAKAIGFDSESCPV
eukprot:scaffold31041_cov56-Attheya_sp.AAC.2